MSLGEYFEKTGGYGVLGTANAEGMVDLALYARPHVMDEHTVAFIMGDHLSHDNITANPHAAYLFVERGEEGATGGYNGLRLYLTRTQEETDPQKIDAVRRRKRRGRDYSGSPQFLVHFRVDQVRRLAGD
jgi:hypothetical protein